MGNGGGERSGLKPLLTAESFALIKKGSTSDPIFTK